MQARTFLFWFWAAAAAIGPSAAAAESPVTDRTNKSTYELHGVTEPGARLRLEVNGKPAGELTAPATGEFTFGNIPLQEGVNVLSVTAADAVGNTTVATKRVFADTIPPPWRFVSPRDGLRTTERQLTIVGESEPGAVVTFRHDGEAPVKVVIPNTGRVYFHLSNLHLGRHHVEATARDELGNVAAAALTFLVKPLPTVRLTPGWTTDVIRRRDLELRGVSAVGNVVTLFDNGVRRAALTLHETGRFRFRLAGLPYGPHAFVVTAQDDLGNEARAAASVEVRAPLPRIAVSGAWNPKIILTRQVRLTGRASPPGVVSLQDNGARTVAATTDASGRFSFPLTDLAYGDHLLELMTVNATHEAATATARLRVIRPLRLTAPPPQTLLNQRRVDVVGTAHPQLVVALFVNGRRQAETSAAADGAFRFPAAQLVEGHNTIRVETQPGPDLRQEATCTLTTDTVPPAVEVVFPAPGTRTRGDKTTVLVHTEPGARVSVSVWKSLLTTVTAPADGDLVVADVPLQDRPVLLTVVARDAAGNKRSASRWLWRALAPASH